MADLEAVLADVSYLMAMEKSKCTPAARKESEDLQKCLIEYSIINGANIKCEGLDILGVYQILRKIISDF